jgi:hypothetical protein
VKYTKPDKAAELPLVTWTKRRSTITTPETAAEKMMVQVA